MGRWIDGCFIAFQFFTTIPIRKEIPMDESRLKCAIDFFPLVGFVIGIFGSFLLWSLSTFTSLSPLAIALIFLFSFVLITGGIHVDGWVDASDAFFSYRDREKRLEIMKDPRVGTFGVLSLFFLFLFRFLFSYETIAEITMEVILLFGLVPICSRVVMGTLLILGPLAKKEGLAHLFHQNGTKGTLSLYGFYLVFLSVMIFFIKPALLQSFFYIVAGCMVAGFFFYQFFKRAFGGMTGDTLGTSIEGTETWLWMIIWLLH